MQKKPTKKMDSMILKGIIIAVVTILLLIPISLVQSLIEERAQNKDTATEEISSKWGGNQNILGPVLVIPYNKTITARVSTEGVVNTQNSVTTGYAYFLPDKYNVDSKIDVEERSRGIYNTLVYQSKNNISGRFNYPNFNDLNIAEEDVKFNEAFFILGVPFMQGITNKIKLNINEKEYDATPGIPINTITKSGLTVKFPINAAKKSEPFNFSYDLSLNGSERLVVTPIGKENNIKMKSEWNIVSFCGDFLPANRTVDNSGFVSEWNIFDYNRNYLQQWVGQNNDVLPEIGVELKYAVDQYQMSIRSVKYAIMFIALTFVIFFLVEILTKRRIHPVQYILVSFALILFYTLLVALSEHINFHIAYLISAIAIVVMITLYVRTVFNKLSHTLAMGGFIAAIYTYLYVLLQLEDMSLLMGVIGLFVALAAIMYASRKVDWYKKDEDYIEEPHQ